MQREQIKELALINGFKLKQQPDGSEDLNPYVYEFAAALMAPLQAEVKQLRSIMNSQNIVLKASSAELERYSMSAGAADQFRREALAMREALGFDKYGDDIAPVDLLNALDRRVVMVIEAACAAVMPGPCYPPDDPPAGLQEYCEGVAAVRDYANQIRQQAKEVQS